MVDLALRAKLKTHVEYTTDLALHCKQRIVWDGPCFVWKRRLSLYGSTWFSTFHALIARGNDLTKYIFEILLSWNVKIMLSSRYSTTKETHNFLFWCKNVGKLLEGINFFAKNQFFIIKYHLMIFPKDILCLFGFKISQLSIIDRKKLHVFEANQRWWR